MGRRLARRWPSRAAQKQLRPLGQPRAGRLNATFEHAVSTLMTMMVWLSESVRAYASQRSTAALSPGLGPELEGNLHHGLGSRPSWPWTELEGAFHLCHQGIHDRQPQAS
jgi:hypothetical protein